MDLLVKDMIDEVSISITVGYKFDKDADEVGFKDEISFPIKRLDYFKRIASALGSLIKIGE